ncbi:MAG: DUF262 domain-containing protein [Bacteroidetes bacterium]|nr:DUF262 domain-containing protein [Bacteroidota bacterium]
MEILKDKKPLDKLYKRRNRYDLQPDFQRGPVWGEGMEQKLLDTILNKWDIPKIFLNTLEDDNYEVVDGQQRLTCIYKFYDNDIPLSEEISENYGGLYYDDLPDKIKDIFDDYEIDFVLLKEATDIELRELFSRLQLGKPLNSGEKLNAINGKMRDFAKALVEHSFFSEKIKLRNTRFSHLSICGQLCILAIKGIENHKFSDIEDFFNSHVNFDENSEYGRRIKKLVNILDQIFPEDNIIFRNRASITTLFIIISELEKAGFDFTEENRKKIKNFYEDFDDKLRKVVEKGAEADDLELVVYQSKVTQGADNKTTTTFRSSILKRRLIEYDHVFKQSFDVSSSEIELVDFRKKETIKELKDSCLTFVTEINKIYQPKEGQDLFKMTTAVLSGSITLPKPIETEEDFKAFIDALYKIIYESSGSLKRIPEVLLNDESVYFDIKHLRTDLFHDVEHGPTAKIKKKKEIISAIYDKYTSKKSLQEIRNSDLIRFQRKLLKNLDSELQILQNKISE